MRQLVTGALLTAVFFLLTPNSFLNGQDVTGPGPNALFAPETPTMWHKLGIPQGVGRIKKYRESRINRTGNKPQRESKPKLVQRFSKRLLRLRWLKISRLKKLKR